MILWGAASPLILWALFLMYCALHASVRSGKLKATPWPVRCMSLALLGVMGTADVLFNITIGSLIFRQLPRQWTFTQRCDAHLAEQGRRGDIARWVCNDWLNPFEQGHCH